MKTAIVAVVVLAVIAGALILAGHREQPEEGTAPIIPSTTMTTLRQRVAQRAAHERQARAQALESPGADADAAP